MDKFALKETKKKKNPHLAVHITAKHWKGTIINVLNCLNFRIIQSFFQHNQRIFPHNIPENSRIIFDLFPHPIRWPEIFTSELHLSREKCSRNLRKRLLRRRATLAFALLINLVMWFTFDLQAIHLQWNLDLTNLYVTKSSV